MIQYETPDRGNDIDVVRVAPGENFNQRWDSDELELGGAEPEPQEWYLS